MYSIKKSPLSQLTLVNVQNLYQVDNFRTFIAIAHKSSSLNLVVCVKF